MTEEKHECTSICNNSVDCPLNEQERQDDIQENTDSMEEKLEEIYEAEQTLPAVQNQRFSVEALLTQAVAKGLPVETLERIMVMGREVKAEVAKEQFISAMAKFQSACPIIKREKVVKGKDGKERYRYAPLDSIVSQVKVALADNNISYKFDEIKDDKTATAVCVVTHTGGHSEQSSFKVEIGNEEYMTSTQKYGARMTFAKRYAFCNAFGIMTGDDDIDGQVEEEKSGKESKVITPETVAAKPVTSKPLNF